MTDRKTGAPVEAEIHSRAHHSLELNAWIASSLEDTRVPKDRRRELAAAAFDLAFEHHASIPALMVNNAYGSAYALIRPLFESCVAGIWFLECAREDLIRRFDEGRFSTDLEKMLRDIDCHPELGGDGLRAMMQGPGRIFHDFTHGGAAQLIRRVPCSRDQTGYAASELLGTLYISDTLVLMAAQGSSGVYELPRFSVEVSQRNQRMIEASLDGPHSPFCRASE